MIDQGITVTLDCGCVFSDDDVFRNQPLVLGAGCAKGVHATFEADAIPVAAVAASEGPLPERFFAVPCPRGGTVQIYFDTGHFEISVAEARVLHGVIGGALAIIDGQHPAQTGAYAATQQSTGQ